MGRWLLLLPSQLLLPLLLQLTYHSCNNELAELIFNCKTWDSDPDPNAKLGLPCIFPFVYKGKEYNGCTQFDDPEKKAWCATAVNETHHYIEKSNQYGHCNLDCPPHRQPIEKLSSDPSSPDSLVDLLGRCGKDSVCISLKKCPQYLEESSALLKISSSGDPSNNTHVQAWKDRVCNQPQYGVCCSSVVAEISKNRTDAEECVPGPRDLGNPAYLPSPELAECGTVTVSSQIVGGINSKPGTHPSAALLGYVTQIQVKSSFKAVTVNKTKNIYFCGGTLINRWYILTAAHCVADPQIPRVSTVALGEYDTENDPDCDPFDVNVCLPAVQIIRVEEGAVTVHQDYDKAESDRGTKDIALVKLSTAAIINEAVVPVCLPVDPTYVANYIGVSNLEEGMEGKWPEVVGWGFTVGNHLLRDNSFNGNSAASRVQQELAVQVQSNAKCEASYRRELKDQICAGGAAGQGSCKGDSGGPLYISKFSHQSGKIVHGGLRFLFGVLSFGRKDCADGHPTVYVRVEKYISWIRKSIGNC